ncbi:MAG TPA: glycosyl hydrolase [Thermoanaerobaculia bacterium]|nr:glycosyl hydrolase [Thermoanaerobaculia bacterium]
MRTPQRILCLAAAGLALALAAPAQQPAAPPAPPAPSATTEIDSNTFSGLEARAIGPAVMSGRIAAIAGLADDPITLYVGTASGGVWKSRDSGVTFKPVFDKHTQSIGAVAIDPKSPQTVWVGTGESCTRNSVSVGDGVYKTTDGGDNWERMGLENSERIAAVEVSPADGNTVWVCATGHLWDDHEERGVYKTTDGGKTWKRTLYVDEKTGCSDLDVDPQEPGILYAGMWEFRRGAAFFSSGGPGSNLYKSTDGGETWKKLETGLPKGNKGRIAVSVAPSRPATVYAIVEAKNTALYRSDDTGETWKEMNSSFNIQVRPFYFAHVVIDPTDHNTVYKPGLFLTTSTDGGKTFNSSFGPGGGSVHGDHHALWINPKNPHEMALGTDGGVYISNDKGGHWRHVKSLPVSQFYRVSYDMDWPYRVYGGLQDNGSWSAPSRGSAGVQNRDWRNIGFGDGFYAFRDPADPDFVYVEYQGGKISRLRLSTGENRDIQPLPAAGDPEYRFNWNTPIHLSASEPGTIYIGSQFLFRSRDRGESWEKISPDLTTNDPKRQQQMKSGGLTVDNSSAENHTTIYSIAESKKNPGVIWVGTDDGYVQVTRDGGKSWTNVSKNIPGVPANTWVSHVEPGHFDEATAYATLDGHTTGDMKTWVFKTTDFGQTWKPLMTPALEGYAHVVREDLESPDLLFLGTEFGLFISVDGGASWGRYTGGDFPRVAVRDIAIHPRDADLILATHGRGVYILDDITPLRKLTRDVLEQEVAFLPSRPSPMITPSSVQEFPGDEEFVGRTPEEAAYVTYYLKKRHIVGDLKLEVYDGKGELVSTLPAGKRKGLNRVAWPMRTKGPRTPGGNSVIQSPFSFFGPRVPAGAYTVKLTKGGQTLASQVQLVADPRATHTAEDRQLQYDTVVKLHGMMERLTFVVDSALGARDALQTRAGGLPENDKLRRQLEAAAGELTKFHSTLVATGEGGWLSGEEQLREKVGYLYGGVNGYEGRPSRAQIEQMGLLGERLDKAAARLDAIGKNELAAANKALAARKLEPVNLMTEEEWKKKAQ